MQESAFFGKSRARYGTDRALVFRHRRCLLIAVINQNGEAKIGRAAFKNKEAAVVRLLKKKSY